VSEPLPPHSPSSPDCRQNAPGFSYCTSVANRRNCCSPAKSHEINVRSKILSALPLLSVPIRTWRPEMMPKGESAARPFSNFLRCNSALAQTRLCNLELIRVSRFQYGSKVTRCCRALLQRFFTATIDINHFTTCRGLCRRREFGRRLAIFSANSSSAHSEKISANTV
jgi:hypothetical protein